eukprot:6205310-Pleurochrysis_carterae.AAC.2
MLALAALSVLFCPGLLRLGAGKEYGTAHTAATALRNGAGGGGSLHPPPRRLLFCGAASTHSATTGLHTLGHSRPPVSRFDLIWQAAARCSVLMQSKTRVGRERRIASLRGARRTPAAATLRTGRRGPKTRLGVSTPRESGARTTARVSERGDRRRGSSRRPRSLRRRAAGRRSGCPPRRPSSS